LTAAAIGQLLASDNDAKVYCKYEVITVCGADMLALGPGAAGAYLRELFLRSGSQVSTFQKTLIVIDEADVMIGRRAKPAATNTSTHNCSSPVKGSPTKRSTVGKSVGDVSENGVAKKPVAAAAASGSAAPDGSCLYQILCACRVNNPNLAVLLTTTQRVAEIDSAVLDRMDYVVEYTNPTAILCAHYLLQCIFELLFIYMGDHSTAESNAAVRPEDYSLPQRVLVKLMEHDARVYDEMCRGSDQSGAISTVDAVEAQEVPVSAQKVKQGTKVKAMRNTKSRPSPARSVSVKAPSLAASKKQIGSDFDGWSEYCANMREVRNDINRSNGGAGGNILFDSLENIVALVESMPTTVVESGGGQLWSYREILKFVRNIQCDILGTERLVVWYYWAVWELVPSFVFTMFLFLFIYL